jgi:5,10-methylenetetrahydromethanopterin reductase
MQFAMQFTFTGPRFTRADADAFTELARMADGYGLRAVGTGDTSFRLGEAASRVTLMALGVRNAFVGMRPTNPWTRDPQVTAGFLASIDSITDGRAFMEIATGDSAVHSVGHQPATRARLEEYVRCVRDLLETGAGHYDGRTIRVYAGPRRPVRISIGAEGPRMLDLAGRIGDAVSIGTGLTPEVITDTLRRVRLGSLAAGRSANAVEPWFTVRSVLDPDRAVARTAVRASLASIMHHSLRAGVEGRCVPERYYDAVREFVAGYALDGHQQSGGANEKLMSDLGLAEFAFERWAMAGDDRDWIERITKLAESGVRRIWLANRGTTAKMRQTLQLLGERVLPQLS